MKKVYKIVDGRLHFQHAWEEDGEVTLRWGAVGSWGQEETYLIDGEYVKDTAVDDVLAQAIKDGYEEIPPERHHALRIHYPIDDPPSSKDEMRAQAIADILDHELSWTGNGHYVEKVLDDGTLEIRCTVVDKDAAIRSAEQALGSHNLLAVSKIIENDAIAK